MNPSKTIKTLDSIKKAFFSNILLSCYSINLDGFRELASTEDGMNHFTPRAQEFSLTYGKSHRKQYLCLFALQGNLLLALKEFEKRGKKIHPLQKCLLFGVNEQIANVPLFSIFKINRRQTAPVISPSEVCVCG